MDISHYLLIEDTNMMIVPVNTQYVLFLKGIEMYAYTIGLYFNGVLWSINN